MYIVVSEVSSPTLVSKYCMFTIDEDSMKYVNANLFLNKTR